MTRGAIERAIAAGSSLCLDTSVVLAYLDGSEPASQVAAQVLDELVRSGRNQALISAVTVTECLVRPFGAGAAGTVGTVEAFLQMFPNMDIQSVDYSVAREAARVRAATGLPTADSMVIATAIAAGVDTLVGNDERWRAALERIRDPVPICLLADYQGNQLVDV